MKRISSYFLLLCCLVGLLASCSKELQTVADDSNLSQNPGTTEAFQAELPTSKGNILAFANEAQLTHYLAKTSMMTSQERVQLEQKLGFESIATIFERVTEAEVQHQDEFFAGLDPNLSAKAYEQMGYKYERSQLFKSYEAKGLVKDILYADGSRAFDLTIHSPYYQNAIGADKAIQIGEGLIQFEGENGDVLTLSNANGPNSASAFKITLNNEYDFVKHARRPGYETPENSVIWLEDPSKGDKYRYYAYVKFTSTFTTVSLSQTYFWSARAEQKKFGNWATRNDYNPIFGINANWSYDYWVIFPGAGFGTVRNGAQYPLPNGTSYPTSPYNLSSLHTNYTVRYMYPHGFVSLNGTEGYQFFENVRLFSNSYSFKFSGGCCGYTYVAQ